MRALYLPWRIGPPVCNFNGFIFGTANINRSRLRDVTRRGGRRYASSDVNTQLAETTAPPDMRFLRFAAVLVAPRSGSIDESSLLPRLPVLKFPEQQRLSTAIFLVTPKLAHLIEKDGTFLTSAMTRIYANIPIPTDGEQKLFRSFVAVVDKIPVSTRRRTDRSIEMFPSEGLALLLTASPHDQMALPADPDKDAQSQATIKFLSNVTIVEDAGRKQSILQHITLPVANTLFINGQRATMYEDTWTRNWIRGARLGRLTGMCHESRRVLQSLSIRLNRAPKAMGLLNLPLEALTTPSRVVNAMGNVIRELEVHGKRVPASMELEAAVTNFRTQKSKESAKDGTLQVYALLKPQISDEEHQLARRWLVSKGDNMTVDSSIIPSLRAGARLYRVTGGGGGWGNKQGLLSLDPSTDFESEANVESLPHLDDETGDLDLPKMANLVPAGSTIQFFASYQIQKGPGGAQRHEDIGDPFTGKDSTCFGVIPPQEIPLTAAASPGQKPSSPSDWTFVVGTFGMFSEGGAALGIDESSEVPSDVNLSTRDLRPATSTRIDVPNTMFRIIVTRGTKAPAPNPVEEQPAVLPEDVKTPPKSRLRRPGFGSRVIIDTPVPEQGTIVQLNPSLVSTVIPDVAPPQTSGQVVPATSKQSTDAASELGKPKLEIRKIKTRASQTILPAPKPLDGNLRKSLLSSSAETMSASEEHGVPLRKMPTLRTRTGRTKIQNPGPQHQAIMIKSDANADGRESSVSATASMAVSGSEKQFSPESNARETDGFKIRRLKVRSYSEKVTLSNRGGSVEA